LKHVYRTNLKGEYTFVVAKDVAIELTKIINLWKQASWLLLK